MSDTEPSYPKLSGKKYNKFEVTDDLRKKYPDITITIDTDALISKGTPQVLVDALLKLLPTLSAAVKDMSIIEAEYMLKETGLGGMFNDIGGEDVTQYIRNEAFKVSVEHNKEKVLKQFYQQWDKMVERATGSQITTNTDPGPSV